MRALVCALLAASATPGAAQIVFRSGPGGSDPSGLLDVAPASYGVSGWTAGEWARYNISQSLGQAGQSLTRFRTLSVVAAAGERFWVEIQEEAVGLMRATQPTRKLLIPFGAVSERAMTEAFTLMPDSSIRHVTVVRPASADPTRPAFPDGWQRTGDETLTTPAGEFRTRHYRRGGEDLWIAAAAGPIGVVRYRGDNVTMELVGWGTSGARSRIPPVETGAP